MGDSKEAANIQIMDKLAGGEYSNAMQILHNDNEFQMFFINVMGNSGRVVSKVIISPGHLKRMLAVMTDNLRKFEDKYGTISEIAGPSLEKEVGFKTND